jgi:general secretion pathway protein G
MKKNKMTDGVVTRSSERGFTLIELLVVMAILGLLAALVLPNYIRKIDTTKIQAARTQITSFGTALDSFRLDVGRYPTTDEGLDALRRKPSSADRWDGPYLQKEIPVDPWNHPYVYKAPGDHGGFDLMSYGADGTPGGDGDNKDITSWESS